MSLSPLGKVALSSSTKAREAGEEEASALSLPHVPSLRREMVAPEPLLFSPVSSAVRGSLVMLRGGIGKDFFY